MVQKCPNCNAVIVRFPLWKYDGDKKIFLWKNLFKMSIDSIILLVLILFLVWSYQYNTKKCDEMVNDPCGYCERTNCCEYLAEQSLYSPAKEPVLPEDLVNWNISFS